VFIGEVADPKTMSHQEEKGVMPEPKNRQKWVKVRKSIRSNCVKREGKKKKKSKKKGGS